MHLLVIGILVSQLLKLPQMYTSFPPLSHLNTMGIDRRAAAEDMGERGGGREGGGEGGREGGREGGERSVSFHSKEDTRKSITLSGTAPKIEPHPGPRRARRLKVAHAHRLKRDLGEFHRAPLSFI